jgi:hypothetical protein
MITTFITYLAKRGRMTANVVAALAIASTITATAIASSTRTTSAAKPTIVLVPSPGSLPTRESRWSSS